MIEASVLLHHKDDVIDRLQTAGKVGSDRVRTAFGDGAAAGSTAGSAPAGEVRTGKRAGSERDRAALKRGSAGLSAGNSIRATAHRTRLCSREFNCEIDGTGTTAE